MGSDHVGLVQPRFYNRKATDDPIPQRRLICVLILMCTRGVPAALHASRSSGGILSNDEH